MPSCKILQIFYIKYFVFCVCPGDIFLNSREVVQFQVWTESCPFVMVTDGETR